MRARESTVTAAASDHSAHGDNAETPETALLRALVTAPASGIAHGAPSGPVVGELLGLTDAGATALVRWSSASDGAAVRARSVVDLYGAHVGRSVVLMFESGDWTRPIVMGVLRDGSGTVLEQRPGQVDVVADGERLIVSAREQLVLRCGKASITLTRAGKVLIQGEYVSSRANGVNRIKGGAVQLN